MSHIWTGQMEEESCPLYTWKASAELRQSSSLSLQTQNLSQGTEGEGRRAPAPSSAQSKHNLPVLVIKVDFKQTLLLSDLGPEQLFSFYCSPRTAP